MAQPGTVKNWKQSKGYGFVTLDNGEDIFVQSNVIGGGRLLEGKRVEVVVSSEQPRRKGQARADRVTGEGVYCWQREGQYEGVVKRWLKEKSIGFIEGPNNEELYVHSSSFGGGRLVEGGKVRFDVEPIEHKSGRRMAVNVSGPGVQGVGKMQGTVKLWIAAKGYGFIEADGQEYFVHKDDINNMSLKEGRLVIFDPSEAEHSSGRRRATNISGPAVMKPEAALLAYLSTPSPAQASYPRPGIISPSMNRFPGAATSPNGIPQQGTVRAWMGQYGFIRGPLGEDIYVSRAVSKEDLQVGQDVYFIADPPSNTGRSPMASLVAVIHRKE